MAFIGDEKVLSIKYFKKFWQHNLLLRLQEVRETEPA